MPITQSTLYNVANEELTSRVKEHHEEEPIIDKTLQNIIGSMDYPIVVTCRTFCNLQGVKLSERQLRDILDWSEVNLKGYSHSFSYRPNNHSELLITMKDSTLIFNGFQDKKRIWHSIAFLNQKPNQYQN